MAMDDVEFVQFREESKEEEEHTLVDTFVPLETCVTVQGCCSNWCAYGM